MNSRNNKWLWVLAALAAASPASALAQEKRISVQGQLTCADTPRLTISARPDGSDSGAVLGGTLVA
ncbi:MAG: hypothetical protein HY053_00130, partial [Proteobacteria bacterium]|nr:hypothetical protein [Pseudomonadota bacterium]